jgi:hypothetical protein
MQNRLLMCATYLKEVEEKLVELQASMDSNLSEKSKVTEALSFVEQARNAISETKTRVDSLGSAFHEN